MNANVQQIGSAVHRDPLAAGKTLVFLLIAVLLLYVVFKFIRGFGKATELIGDLAPSTEAEKEEIVTSSGYQDGIKWLDDRIGINTIVTVGKYSRVTDYLLKKNFPMESISKAAQTIWDAKVPFYIDSNAVYNAIASVPSKACVSLIAFRFDDMFKNKTGFYPLNGFLEKYLKPNELAIVVNIINKKPQL